MAIEILNLTSEVARLLRTDAALMDLFTEGGIGYCCAVCGQPGDITDEQPVSVVMLVHDAGTARPLARLAHGWCAQAGVRTVHDPTVVDIPANWPAVAWLRPPAHDPAPVLLLGTSTGVSGIPPTMVDRFTAPWRERGFTPLDHPHAPIADLDGLTVHLGTGGAVSLWHHHGQALWDGTIAPPPGWAQAARRSGRIAVVIAAGMRLHIHRRNHLADLRDATRDQWAVAATAHLLTNTD